MFLDESDEIMHGVGLRSSSHSVNASNHQETEFSGQCKNAISYAKNERKVMFHNNHIISYYKPILSIRLVSVNFI